MNMLSDLCPTTHHDFLADVIDGLSSKPKSIPCKWFYDEIGSILFEKITETEEYYPTRVETRLLKTVAQALPDFIPELEVIIEPGSGSSVKTRVLLETQPKLTSYIPMDISAEFLGSIANQLHIDYPTISTIPLVGDFTNISTSISGAVSPKRLVFFPGSTIGNFSPIEAKRLLTSFHYLAGESGYLLIGVDGTQDEDRLLAAYDDQTGITAAFNKNLLVRANRELNANFNIDNFEHLAKFNVAEQKVEMHLQSKVKQVIEIGQSVFTIEADETIFTENCYKYDRATFIPLANNCGWKMLHSWQDTEQSHFQIFLLSTYQSV